MDKKYSDLFELIVLGHNAHLSPQQIHQRFVDGGLRPERTPPPHVIHRIGRRLLGDNCRWLDDRMRSWHNGVTITADLLRLPKALPNKKMTRDDNGNNA
jgi:hypothetical protein